MLSPPFLTVSGLENLNMVETDMSPEADDAVLSQIKEDKSIHPIQFSGDMMTVVELWYYNFERETMSVVFKLQTFWLLLLSTR